MSDQNVEIVRQGYEAFNRRDLDAVLAGMHPDVEWHVPDILPEPDTYHGPEGVRRFWEGWMESFDDFTVEVTELVDCGERVVAMTRVGGRVRGSGSTLHTPTYAQVWTFRDGQVVRVEMFPSKEEALEAGGAAR
jgi:ketosteroid isomerase-like protein